MTDNESLIGKIEALRLVEKNSLGRNHNIVLDKCISVIRSHCPAQPDITEREESPVNEQNNANNYRAGTSQPEPAEDVVEIIRHALELSKIFAIKNADRLNAGAILSAIGDAQAAIAALPQAQPVSAPRYRAGDIIPSADLDFAELVAVPAEQMETIYERLCQLTNMGQTHFKAFNTQSKEITKLKGDVFVTAESAQLLAGNWVKKNRASPSTALEGHEKAGV